MPNKKAQYCSLCQNHKEVSLRRGHKCNYRECLCSLCKLTKVAQNCMRYQQKFWRHQKSKLKNYKECPELKVDDHLVDDSGQLKGQVCDKCRNHNHLTRKKNHNCPYLKCDCQLCFLTFRRRKVMRHHQRLRRCNATTKIFDELSNDSWDEETLEGPSDKEGDSIYFQKLSLMLSSLNSKKKKYYSGLSSTYPNTEADPTEEPQTPASFYAPRSMSSPPPLIPIDLPDTECVILPVSDHDDEEASAYEDRRYVPSPKLCLEMNPSLHLQNQNSTFSNSPTHTSDIISTSRSEFVSASLAHQGNPMPNLIRLDDYFFAKPQH